jgi:hypothetical protein
MCASVLPLHANMCASVLPLHTEMRGGTWVVCVTHASGARPATTRRPQPRRGGRRLPTRTQWRWTASPCSLVRGVPTLPSARAPRKSESTSCMPDLTRHLASGARICRSTYHLSMQLCMPITRLDGAIKVERSCGCMRMWAVAMRNLP